MKKNPLFTAIDVHPATPHEADQGCLVFPSGLDGGGHRRRPRHHHRYPVFQGLKNHLGGDSPRADQNLVIQGDTVQGCPADDLIDRIVAAHIISKEEDLVLVTEQGGVDAARPSKEVGPAAQVIGKGKDFFC